ncbi:preprotein translocase subunit SecE [Bacillus horti]|uniref:Protein translocase subunit SecE n=1 Tax=Caldalkalibacillus horti TaxID=77523 RepID=A0ABT9VYK4_9BACI|nr:preprotein translocase subunit SecE [Bacillus horti]MDQ0166049.1 preprotein translocase subunit SecE [Bacillus horti]
MGFLSKIGNGFRKSAHFFRDGWLELKKVRWPNRKELVSYTLVVLTTVVLIAIFFTIIDSGLSELLRVILG